jgi:hypothetical protein
MSEVLVTVLVLAFLAAFIVDLIGNLIVFNHKISSAIASTLVFGLIVAGLTFWLNSDYRQAAVATGMLFVADLVCNYLVPRSRLLNALATGLLFAGLLFGFMAFVG